MSKSNTSYVELSIINNSGKTSPIPDTSLYLSLYAGDVPFTIDANTGISTPGTAGTVATPLLFSDLTGKKIKLDSSIQMASGRLYFSSSSTPITSGGPSITDSPDYFDWLEFTLNGPSTTSHQFVINTTQVDQFGFPITISDMTPADPAFGTKAGSNPTITRSKIFDDFKKLPSEYQDCSLPNTKDSSKPNLRILSPGNAIVKDGSIPLATAFNDTLKKFFQQAPFTPKPGELKYRTPVYINSVGGYPYVGTLTTVNEKGIDNKMHTYPVLQFNYVDKSEAPNPLGIPTPPPSGTGPYNLYFPFFSTNSGSAYPAPPIWWNAKKGQNNGSLPLDNSPSQMAFSANGIFADNAFQLNSSGTFYSDVQQQIIGNLENQLNVAFNRGYANSIKWITLTGSISPSGNTKNGDGLFESTITLNDAFTAQDLPNTAVNLNIGMQVMSYASSQPLKIATIAKDKKTFTVTSAKEILAQNPQYLTFSNFYECVDTENSYADFFHKKDISIEGRAYAMPFDDQGGFSSTLTSDWGNGNPTSLTITLGAWN